MPIPLVDLGWQHRLVEPAILEGFRRVFERTSFILGEEVAAFEHAYASFASAEHCVGTSSGTDALELALRAAGIGDGDEVILPANTFIATALAVVRAGGRPVLCDVDPDHGLIDPADAERRRTTRTRAIIPVHLYGQMAPMDAITSLAEAYDLAVIEDAAQAHGASQLGRSPGAGTTAAATSFYPGKNLGAYGDAGAVLTNDARIASQVRALRNWGSDVKYEHPQLGFNARLDTIQAVVLAAKLEFLADWNKLRADAAASYRETLSEVAQVGLPWAAPGNEHVWHLFVVRVPDRDRVLQALQQAGVGAGIHYPIPIHRQGPFRHLDDGSFPVTDRWVTEILSLPMFPGLSNEQIDEVSSILRAAVHR